MKLGILGGTFDPIHLGHLRAAEEIGQDFNLEKVYLIPSSSPPHKTGKPVSPFHHRLAMAQLAAEESPLLDAHDMEGRRPGLSYSIETLREFQRVFSPKPEVFFILGMDAFLEIDTWKEYRSLFDYAHFVVIHRPGQGKEDLEPFLSTLGLKIRRSQEDDSYVMPSTKELMVSKTTLMDISSTHIRNMVQDDRSIRFLVSESVRNYIIEKGLYKRHEHPR